VAAVAMRGGEDESRIRQAVFSCPCSGVAQFGLLASWVDQADGSAYRHVGTRPSKTIAGGRNRQSVMPPIGKGISMQDAVDCFLGDSRQARSPNEAVDR
jgi:hypothetical protein